MPADPELLARAARAMLDARYPIAFTGAGASAESGIPVFRGTGGVWEKYDQRHLEIGYFLREPASAWRTIRALFYAGRAEPNAAHRALAAWEADGFLRFLVTQNIDGLHGAAGSREVAEFHGGTGSLACTRCGLEAPADRAALAALRDDELPPRCGACGGVQKPGFTFFGEAIPEAAGRAAFEAAGRADFCLVVGSTGLVYPAASIPETVAERGGVLVEINVEPTRFTSLPGTIFLRGGAAETCAALDAALRASAAGRGGRSSGGGA